MLTKHLNTHILRDIRQAYGAEDEDDASLDGDLNEMTGGQLFRLWCQWKGFGSYADDITAALGHIRAALTDDA